MVLLSDGEIMNPRVYWITGLSGAGKSTVGSLLYSHLKQIKENVILLDGDLLREVFSNNQKYSLKDREQLSMQYSRLSKLLISQGFDVVISTISMFHDTRSWNRRNIINYVEIYIEVPVDILIARDQKKLYSRALRGEIDNVMGIDIEVQAPISPDVVLVNDGTRTPEKVAQELIDKLNLNITKNK